MSGWIQAAIQQNTINNVLQHKCGSDVLQIKEMSHQLMAVLYDENKFF